MTSQVRTHSSHAFCDAKQQLCPVDERGRLKCDCVDEPDYGDPACVICGAMTITECECIYGVPE